MVVFVDELGPKQLGQIRTLIESGFPHWVGWRIPGISQVLREWQRTR